MNLELSTKKYLDTLSDDDLYLELDLRYGMNQPIWEGCSETEYKENNPIIKTLEDLEKWINSTDNYRVEPYYDKPGLLYAIEHTPSYYKYYKQVGTERILMLGSAMINYLNERKSYWL